MSRFGRLPLKRQLMLVITLTSFVSLALACTFFIVYDFHSFRGKMVNDLRTLAEVTAKNCAASLMFDEPDSANEVLLSLAATSNIHCARIYTPTGESFASYVRTQVQTDCPAPTSAGMGHRFTDGHLKMTHTILLEGRTVGVLHIEAGIESLRSRLEKYILTGGIVLVVACLVSLLLATKFQALISRPLLELTSAAKAVRGEMNYSIRVHEVGNHEIGLLTTSFNEMLEQIQTRDDALQKTEEELRLRLEQLQAEIEDRETAEKALSESEDQLRQAQKMEAVGRLAGGIAHDFNNLLTAINGYSEMILDEMPETDPTRVKIQEILQAGHRAATLTRQLLAFSRKQILEPQPMSLNACVSDMQKMLQRLIGEDIELHSSLERNLGIIEADPGQVDQVVMNLAVNARDAMPRGGKLTIETRNVELDATYRKQYPEVKEGPFVMLAIGDTGCGMTEETRGRIFEPFYTTKEQGKGTGLGLSTVFGIVKQTGGHITVYSEVGVGTVFRIYLPRSGKVSADQPRSAASKSMPRGTGTILLVEDSDLVRELTESLLKRSGFQVLSAAEGEEALRISSQHSGIIDLMITDVIMPRMNGKEVYKRVADSRPDIKVLYMSGYADTAIVHAHGVLESGLAFIPKPFSPEQLWKKVSSIMGMEETDTKRGIGSS